MFSVAADDINRLIKISWSENVSADEVRECAEQLRALTAEPRVGFRLLTDLTGLESMDPTSASYIAAMMDEHPLKRSASEALHSSVSNRYSLSINCCLASGKKSEITRV